MTLESRSVRTRSPSSWLAPAVLSCLCCFPITGVIALYYAAQVDVRWSLADARGAITAARRARAWTLASFLLWIIATVFLFATGRAGRLLQGAA